MTPLLSHYSRPDRMMMMMKQSIFMLALVSVWLHSLCAPVNGRNLQPQSASPTYLHYQNYHQTPQAPLLSHHICPNNVPVQWRPHMDAPSKAYSAPIVALGTLEYVNLVPLPVGGSAYSSSSSSRHQQAISNYAQSINNAGLRIETSFKIGTILKRTQPTSLRANQNLRLFYRISATLSTSSEWLAVASNLNASLSTAPVEPRRQLSLPQLSPPSSSSFSSHNRLPFQTRGLLRLPVTPIQCALDLSEHELSRKVANMFKPGRNYVLFLDQESGASANTQRHLPMFNNGALQQRPPIQQVAFDQQQQQHQQLYPFATHEPLTNQTSRQLRRVLCKGCAQEPQIQLLNNTYFSNSAGSTPTAGAQQLLNNNNNNNNNKTTNVGLEEHVTLKEGERPRRTRTVRLDCRITGYPTTWVEWYKNGQLLRNKSARAIVRTHRKRYNVRLSRLELELVEGRNETGIYECRAMNVKSREPKVGTYSLLVLAAHYVLVPMQRQLVATASPEVGPPTSPDGGGEQAHPSPERQLSNNNNNHLLASSLAAADGSTSTPHPSTSGGSGSADGPIGAKQASTKGHTQRQNPNSEPPATSNSIQQEQEPAAGVVGQQCPQEAHDNFCLNKGTCVLIGHIEEYFCNCAEGYYGHRCEYKSLGHQQASRR